MENTNPTEFLQAVQQNATLKQKFKAASDLQACLNVALQSGHTFTAAELQAGLNRLSEEQLAEIANPGVAPRRHLEPDWISSFDVNWACDRNLSSRALSMLIGHKNAVGMFPDRLHTESALSCLKEADFPMNKVSIVAQHITSADAALNNTDLTVQTEAQFVWHRTIEQIEHSAVAGTGWGSIVGFLGAGLVTLAIPGIGSIVSAGTKAASVGLTAGAFYGAVAGGLLGSVIGVNISNEQVRHYRERLAQGQYLLVIKGTDTELRQAEMTLSAQGLQNWIIFDAL